MKTIDTNELATVAGGASKNDQLTTTLTSVQSSIKDLASQRSNSGSNDLLLPMAMMMAFNRPQAPTVVTAGAAVAPAAAGPVINISNRIGRRW
jgi:bacteriocin-like protein